MFLEKTLFWFACQHHILELIFSAAVRCELGPTFALSDHFFSKFGDCFNSFNDSDLESLVQKAAEKIKILAPEDEVTRKFHNQACNFVEFFNSLHDFKEEIIKICLNWSK